jgi:hypothetical protein
MEINEIGKFEKIHGQWTSTSFNSTALKGNYSFQLEEYEEADHDDFKNAMLNFSNHHDTALKEIEEHIYNYYLDVKSAYENDDFFDEEDLEDMIPSIKSPSDIWKYVTLGSTLIVSRRYYKDKKIYISLESECEWEPEHGLQIVFKEGKSVNKIGSFDGHLTNSDAYDDDSLENVIYKTI